MALETFGIYVVVFDADGDGHAASWRTTCSKAVRDLFWVLVATGVASDEGLTHFCRRGFACAVVGWIWEVCLCFVFVGGMLVEGDGDGEEGEAVDFI